MYDKIKAEGVCLPQLFNVFGDVVAFEADSSMGKTKKVSFVL